VEVDKIFLVAQGKEKVKWEEHWDEAIYEGEGAERRQVDTKHHMEKYDEKEVFFKNKIKIKTEGDWLYPGQYAFPFQFQLPLTGRKGGKLAGSFHYKDGDAGWRGVGRQVRDLKAKVEYSLVTVIDLEGEKDLEERTPFAVYEQLVDALVLPSGSNSKDVVQCLCINKGKCTVSAQLEKNFYYPGDTARVIATFDNNSTVPVQARAEFNRFLKFKADGHEIYDQDMKDYRFETVGPMETGKVVHMEFPIPKSLPSTDAKYIDCAYRMDIVAAVEWGGDIEMQFPVRIYLPMVPPESYLQAFMTGEIDGYMLIATRCEVSELMGKIRH